MQVAETLFVFGAELVEAEFSAAEVILLLRSHLLEAGGAGGGGVVGEEGRSEGDEGEDEE
jgi:hypothetical protein